MKINDDDDLNSMLKEIDGSSVSNVMSGKKAKKKKKKIKLGNISLMSESTSFLNNMEESTAASSENGSLRQEKRLMKSLPKPPSKKIKLEDTSTVEADTPIPEDDDHFEENDAFDNDDFDDEPPLPPKTPTALIQSDSTDNISPKMADMKVEEDIVKAEVNWEETVQSQYEQMEEDDEEEIDFGDDDANLVFYWLDVYENTWNRDGKLYLTGRTKDGNSCCVTVENVPNVIYILPKDDSSPMEVFQDIEKILSDKVNTFKSRTVTKKNYFGGPDIPAEAEYMRVEFNTPKSGSEII